MKNSLSSTLWPGIKSGLRFSQDLSLWILISSVVLHLVGPLDDLRICILPAFLSGAAAAVGDTCSPGGQLRYLGVIPLFLPFFMLHHPASFAVVIPGSGYLLMCVMRERLGSDYTSLYEHFTSMLWICGICGLLLTWEKLPWGMPLALVTAASLIFLLRVLRQEQNAAPDRRSIVMNLTFLLLFIAAALLLGDPRVLSLAGKTLYLLYRLLVAPVIQLIALLLGGLLYLIILLGGLLIHREASHSVVISTFDDVARTLGVEQSVTEPALWLGTALRVLGVLVFLAAAAAIFRYLYLSTTKQRSVSDAGAETHRRILRDNELPAPDRAPGRFDRSPAARVRRAYGTFYRSVRRGRMVGTGETSGEIITFYVSPEHREEARRLRELYLRARYQADGKLTPAEAREAELLARRIED